MRSLLSFILSCCCVVKINSIHYTALASNSPIKSTEVSIFNKLRISEETKTLPWQATLLLKLFKPQFLQEKEETLLISTPRREKFFVSDQFLDRAYKWIEKYFKKVLDWGLSHQKTFNIAVKASIFTVIGMRSYVFG
jgi:hypothetical protein